MNDIILAIDSGIEKTGFAFFKKNKNNIKLVYSGLIKTSSKNLLENRLSQIYIELKKLIQIYKPNLVVIERLFFFKNQKTAIYVSQAQGISLLLASQNKIKVEYMTPLQIKQIITGYGQSDKKSVQKMLNLILKLDKKITQDDEADAIACGLAYCYINKSLK